jgi:hypothetical protein
MTTLIEKIEHEGEMLALIVRDDYSKPGVTFFTPGDLSQQLAYMRHPAGKVIAAHVHNPVPRSVAYTQETLFIKRGRLRVDFFDERQEYLESRELAAGDVILLIKGEHGFSAGQGGHGQATPGKEDRASTTRSAWPHGQGALRNGVRRLYDQYCRTLQRTA